jgi:hypothetical protein
MPVIDPTAIPLGPLADLTLVVRTADGIRHSDPFCPHTPDRVWDIEVVTLPATGSWDQVVPTLTTLCPECGQLPEDAERYRQAVEWLVMLTAVLTLPEPPEWTAELTAAMELTGELITPPGFDLWPQELAALATGVAATLV